MHSRTTYAIWLFPVLALGLFARTIAAAPYYVNLEARDASSLGVDLLYPRLETTWWVGEYHNVTWDPCSLPDDMDDNTPGTFYLLNNETLPKPLKLVSNSNWASDRVALQEPVPAVQDDAGYRIGLVFGDASIDGKACDTDISCGPAFTIRDGSESDCEDE